MEKNLQILIVEDDELQKLTLEQFLRPYGVIRESSTKENALSILKEKTHFDIVFIDLDLKDGELGGLALIQPSLKNGAYVIVLSGRQEDHNIIEAYQKGCHDFLTKPFNKNSLEFVLAKYSITKSKSKDKFKNFLSSQYITKDEDLIASLKMINEIVLSKEPVLLLGATGTGKSYLAKLIHQLIFKTDQNFLALNCSEIPENLLESELFGYERGAFSGAEKAKKGKLLLADGGTLFLDEIGTMPILLQKKILKVIEEKMFFPLGSDRPVRSDFRLISATCEDLNQMVKKGQFREDLYYRVEGFNINLKSLSRREGDINLLLKHFIKSSTRRIVLTEEARKALNQYSWPGNIRELQRLVKKLSLSPLGVIGLADLPDHIKKNNSTWDNESRDGQNQDDSDSLGESLLRVSELAYVEKNGLRPFVENIENDLVCHFYSQNNEKVRKTLEQLKISNSSFYKIMGRIKSKVLINEKVKNI